ncbi:MAG: DUF484 family protein [Alphaproteobacteria bacterium]|nr:DUF484 family protein [Alphaproteobacteria bacterium]
MNKDRKNGTAEREQPLSEEDIRGYLKQHPDFFDQNRDLLAILKPTRPKHGDGIIDFQAVLRDRLQHEVASLNDAQGSLIHASRRNMTTQARIHAAVLTLMEARDFDHLCHITCHDLVDILQLDSLTLCFERDEGKTLPQNANIRLLKPGLIAEFLGHEATAILRDNVRAAREIYGPATPLIKAEALVRIDASDRHPVGILAFGSRDKTFFAPGQGTELLRFLAAAFHGHLKKLLP